MLLVVRQSGFSRVSELVDDGIQTRCDAVLSPKPLFSHAALRCLFPRRWDTGSSRKAVEVPVSLCAVCVQCVCSVCVQCVCSMCVSPTDMHGFKYRGEG